MDSSFGRGLPIGLGLLLCAVGLIILTILGWELVKYLYQHISFSWN